MKFAVYHPWVYHRGGCERFLLELALNSRHDWTILTHHYAAERTFPEFSCCEVRELEPGVSVRRSLGPLIKAARTIARTELPDDEFQGLLVSSEGFGDFVASRTTLPSAVYCHTPLKIVHDPVTRAALRTTRPQQAAAVQLLGPMFNTIDRRMWRRYRHAFANSTETAQRCVQAGLVPNGPTEVLHPGVDLNRFHPGGKREGFLLVAGRIMWQKNIEVAIDAVRVLRDRGITAPLVIAGGIDGKSQVYAHELHERAEGLDVSFIHDPSDIELADLYARCAAVLFTPPNEDFGIVPLEAMASGAPVIAVDAGGPRETVLHGVTGWLVANTAEAFADAAEPIVRDPAAFSYMRHAARVRAMSFSWQALASRIDDVMEQLAVEPELAAVPVPRPPLALPALPSVPSLPVPDEAVVRFATDG